MPRAIVVVLDSMGVGAAADAAKYGNSGADTFGHIVEACAAGHMAAYRFAAGWPDGVGDGSGEQQPGR
jgi:phosphopentomutase